MLKENFKIFIFFLLIFSCDNLPYGEWDNAYDLERDDEVPPGLVTDVVTIGGDRQVTLSWNNPDDIDFASVEISYGVEDSRFIYDGVIDPEGTVISELENDKTYTFELIAIDTVDNRSEPVICQCDTRNTLPPGEVSDLNISVDTGKIILTWSDPTDKDFKNVEIWYGISDATQLYTGPVNSNGTEIENILNDTTYIVKIITVDIDDIKSEGIVESIDTIDTIAPPEVLSLSATTGDRSISVEWTVPTSDDLDHYEIWYGIDSADQQFDGIINTEGTEITGLTNDTYYTVIVKTVDSSGNVSEGNTVSISTLNTLSPGDVSGLSATGGNKQITLSWTPPADTDFIGVEIWYGVGNTNTRFMGDIDSEETIITGLLDNTNYSLKVIAVDFGGLKSSGVTTEISTDNLDPPAEVSNFSSISGVNQITIAWTNPADADFDRVEIWYGIGNYNTQYSLEPNYLGTVISALDDNTEYSIKIITIDSGGNSSDGYINTEVTANTLPPGEVTGVVTTPGDGEVILSWSNPLDVDFDHVELWYGVGNTDTLFTGTVDNSGTVINGLGNDTTYSFKIITVDTNSNTSVGVEFDETTFISLGLGILLTTPWDESITFDKTDNIVLDQNDLLTVSISESFDSYSWYLLGLDLSLETSSSVTINCADLNPGIHMLYAIVGKGDSSYSEKITFEVRN